MNTQYPRVIQPTAVLVGDLIELTDESRPDWLERDRAVRGGAGVLVGRWVMDNLSRLTVRLLDRPTQPIPTEPGTLIRATVKDCDGPVDLRVSATGVIVPFGGGTYVLPSHVTAWTPLVAVEQIGEVWLGGHEASYASEASPDDTDPLTCECGWASNRSLFEDDRRAYARHILTEAGVWSE